MPGQCCWSPQQGWVGDPGWAPMSMRRSLAPRMFLFLPNLDSLLRAPTLFSSVFVYCTFLKFYRFYEFFWAVVILTKLSMWTFIFFFRCWLLTSLRVIIHFLLFHIHGFALPCLDLEVPTYAMYRSGLALLSRPFHSLLLL